MQNNSLLYSVSFTEETARISIRDLPNGLYKLIVTLPITVWRIIQHQQQQFDTYHQGQVPITENQLGTHAMGHEVAVISGHHYPHVNGTDFPTTTFLEVFSIHLRGRKDRFPITGAIHRRQDNYPVQSSKTALSRQRPMLMSTTRIECRY